MTKDPNSVRMSGPLAGYGKSLAEELARQGYPADRVLRHLRLLAHLSHWLDGRCLTAVDLSDSLVAEFLTARRTDGYAQVPTVPWALTLLGYAGLVVSSPDLPEKTAVDLVIDEYRHFLVCGRGLAAGTVRGYLDAARLFLSHLEGADGLDLSRLTAAQVTQFVVDECRRRNVGSASVMVTALRSFLRFSSMKGYTTHELAGAVPAASSMHHGSLPRGLAHAAVTALLASCDTSTPTGLRDFAILTVLARLGLRAGEVAGLQLEDLDWHHGEVVVHGKGARQDRLPLPTDVGEAVVAYLSSGRPRVHCRSLFLRVHAPITAMTTSNVTQIVLRACQRAGIPPASAHRLRHSAATAMLQGGASLAEIGQVLRQARSATTALYAKVDRAALRTLARPWPEVSA